MFTRFLLTPFLKKIFLQLEKVITFPQSHFVRKATEQCQIVSLWKTSSSEASWRWRKMTLNFWNKFTETVLFSYLSPRYEHIKLLPILATKLDHSSYCHFHLKKQRFLYFMNLLTNVPLLSKDLWIRTGKAPFQLECLTQGA